MFATFGPRLAVKMSPWDGFAVRISENARQMVVFFGVPNETGKVEYAGTGFLALYKRAPLAFPYLVTAAHVAEKLADHGAVLRVNDKSGGSIPFDLERQEWFYHPDPNVDVAVTPCALPPSEWGVSYYSLDDIVDPTSSEFRVQCGDPICIIGNFRLHSGTNRNTPIVHTGNIALLPDPTEPIPVVDRLTNKKRMMEAYLVQAQTLDGLSGAPVFQREMVSISQFGEHNGGKAIVATGAQLLGLYASAWEGESSPNLTAGRGWSIDRRVPVGMGVVVPVARIMEVILNDKKLKATRDEQIDADERARAATTDSAFPPASAENPTHRADFNRLLSAAARKREQED